MRALKNAAARGVKVQGKPDTPFVLSAAQCLYYSLTRNHIEVFEYIERPLHAKIASIDDGWLAMGSSNLEPLSLALNLEANIFVRHPEFNRQLTGEMCGLIDESVPIKFETVKRWHWWTQLSYLCIYYFLRFASSMIVFIPNPVQKSNRYNKNTK